MVAKGSKIWSCMVPKGTKKALIYYMGSERSRGTCIGLYAIGLVGLESILAWV